MDSGDCRITNELLIEVGDSYLKSPSFGKVANQPGAAGHTPTGLGWEAYCRACLPWDVKRDVHDEVVGKTVQAILPVG